MRSKGSELISQNAVDVRDPDQQVIALSQKQFIMDRFFNSIRILELFKQNIQQNGDITMTDWRMIWTVYRLNQWLILI